MSRRLTNHYIHSHVHLGCVGVMLELGLETQSIRQAPMFQQLALDLCLQIAARDPQDVPDLLQQAFLKDPRKSVGNHLHDAATDLQNTLKSSGSCDGRQRSSERAMNLHRLAEVESATA